MTRAGSIAVALHDVEPATFERCALIRDWLDDHGIERVTLLVIPAPDLHPFHDRRPEMVQWLADCAARGDAIAQHGFQHRASLRPRRGAATRPPSSSASTPTRRAARSRPAAASCALAGVRPRGFVAPAYAYTDALRETLAASFDWWASLVRHLRARRARRSPRR